MDITLDSNVLVYAFVPPIHKNEVKQKNGKICTSMLGKSMKM